MMLALIKRMDRWLAANRPDYYARLQLGVSDATLDAFEVRFSLKLPQAFRRLYQWRNGQEPACNASFQANRMFSSLEEVAVSKEILDGLIGYDFEDPCWWRKGWVPFLANGGGDHLCVDAVGEDSGQPGQVLTFWHDWENRSVKYGSLEEWMSELVNSMENNTLELA
jgi:cell wall assembly regulator SMI1